MGDQPFYKRESLSYMPANSRLRKQNVHSSRVRHYSSCKDETDFFYEVIKSSKLHRVLAVSAVHRFHQKARMHHFPGMGRSSSGLFTEFSKMH